MGIKRLILIAIFKIVKFNNYFEYDQKPSIILWKIFNKKEIKRLNGIPRHDELDNNIKIYS